MVVVKEGSGYWNEYGVFSGRVTADTPVKVLGPGRYPVESKVELPGGRKILVQNRFLESL